MTSRTLQQRGLTLVEVLITMAMAGLVVAGMFTLYLNMQRTTYSQEEVVDSQHALRVALDAITYDIRQAGLLLSPGIAAIGASSTATRLDLQTASSQYTFARIERASPGGVFTVAQPRMLDPFLQQMAASAEPVKARIFRPGVGRLPPIAADLTLKALTTDEQRADARTARALSVQTNSSYDDYTVGDMIALVSCGAPDPSTVSWEVVDGKLLRLADAATDCDGDGTADSVSPAVIADGVTALRFTYLGASGEPIDSFPLTAASVEQIVAVQVSVQVAVESRLDDVNRPRMVSSVIRLKNRNH